MTRNISVLTLWAMLFALAFLLRRSNQRRFRELPIFQPAPRPHKLLGSTFSDKAYRSLDTPRTKTLSLSNDTRRGNSIASLPLRLNSWVSSWMLLLLVVQRRPVPRKKPPQRFRLLWDLIMTRLARELLPAWRGLAATSRDCPASPRR